MVTPLLVAGVILASLLNDAAANRLPHDCLDQLILSQFQRKRAYSGVYTIKPDHLPPFKVYCDMETDGGGWTVFQRRMDGSEDFYRVWKDYRLGFGDLKGEFWLGLEKIIRLTKAASSIRFDLEDFSDNKKYAKYSSFSIGNALTQYRLSVSGYSGNAGDSFTQHNGMKFSTKDRDNDNESSFHCAVGYKGAWWYNLCVWSNLNGPYRFGRTSGNGAGVNWYRFGYGYNYSLMFSEMKVRRN